MLEKHWIKSRTKGISGFHLRGSTRLRAFVTSTCSFHSHIAALFCRRGGESGEWTLIHLIHAQHKLILWTTSPHWGKALCFIRALSQRLLVFWAGIVAFFVVDLKMCLYSSYKMCIFTSRRCLHRGFISLKIDMQTNSRTRHVHISFCIPSKSVTNFWKTEKMLKHWVP